MADVIVTFGRVNDKGNLELGRQARTEVLTIGASAAQTSIAAGSGDNVVTILALGDCWVAIDSHAADDVASSATGTKRRAMRSNTDRQFAVTAGDKVAVITRS